MPRSCGGLSTCGARWCLGGGWGAGPGVRGVTPLSALEGALALGLPWPSSFVHAIGREEETLITLLTLETLFDPEGQKDVS